LEFHEHCGFPLFWLDPDRLKTRDARKQEAGQCRRLIGHDTVFALSNRNDERLTRGIAVWSDELGEDPDRTMQKESGFAQSRVGWIWRDAQPRKLSPDAPLIDEFTALLSRPDILFAADVWAMRQLGNEAWRDLQMHLDKIDLSDWYESFPTEEPKSPLSRNRKPARK
jgi:hypothetical protein